MNSLLYLLVYVLPYRKFSDCVNGTYMSVLRISRSSVGRASLAHSIFSCFVSRNFMTYGLFFSHTIWLCLIFLLLFDLGRFSFSVPSNFAIKSCSIIYPTQSIFLFFREWHALIVETPNFCALFDYESCLRLLCIYIILSDWEMIRLFFVVFSTASGECFQRIWILVNLFSRLCNHI